MCLMLANVALAKKKPAEPEEHFQTDFSISPRYEYIASGSETLANRAIVTSKLSIQKSWFSFVIEGFGEFDNVPAQDQIRRTPNTGYLQEAYIEGKWSSLYIRLGKQALRWSDTWVIPSLDVWTGRRFNRFLFDPQTEQFNHSTGASLSYAVQNFSIDLVGITNLGESTFPEPYPETVPGYRQSDTGYGGRIQYDISGFHFSALAAQQATRFYSGATANYAFDSIVPKLEAGYKMDTNDPTIIGSSIQNPTNTYFGTVGIDFFIGRWTITPQFTGFTIPDPKIEYQNEGIAYISITYQADPHDLQAAAYYNTVNQDSFLTLTYNYHLNNHFSIGGFIQRYSGDINVTEPSLYAEYQKIIGGNGVATGARIEAIF